MKLDKIKSLAFLFTIFFSLITYSQSQTLLNINVYDNAAGPNGEIDATTACSSINGGNFDQIYFQKSPGNNNITIPESGDILFTDSDGNNAFNSAGTVFFGWVDVMTNQNKSIEVDPGGIISNISDCTPGAGGALLNINVYDNAAGPNGEIDATTACSSINGGNFDQIYFQKSPGNNNITIPESGEIKRDLERGSITFYKLRLLR